MPSEDSFKAQIQAALAKKKQQQAAANPEPEKAPASEPKIEINITPPVEMANSSTPSIPNQPPPVATPHSLIFGGRSIRFTIHQHQVFFAVNDLLPLAKDYEWNDKLVEFMNNPKTKKEAEDLTTVLTFKNEDGSDKTEGSTASNAIKIFHALGLRPPGPLGRWLNEVSTHHASKD
jgi:hypothetical protein